MMPSSASRPRGREHNITQLGVTCALCHSTVDNSAARIGRRMDGADPRPETRHHCALAGAPGRTRSVTRRGVPASTPRDKQTEEQAARAPAGMAWPSHERNYTGRERSRTGMLSPSPRWRRATVARGRIAVSHPRHGGAKLRRCARTAQPAVASPRRSVDAAVAARGRGCSTGVRELPSGGSARYNKTDTAMPAENRHGRVQARTTTRRTARPRCPDLAAHAVLTRRQRRTLTDVVAHYNGFARSDSRRAAERLVEF